MDKEKEMSADDFCQTLIKNRPQLFDFLFKEAKLIHEYEQGIFKEPNNEEETYWSNEELIIAKAIVCDFGNKTANKIGKIIVSATE